MADDRISPGEREIDGFGSTNWSLVISARQGADQSAALNRLCRAYWRPVYVFCRRTGLGEHDAEDATQEFFAHLLDRSWLDRAGEARGSFRGFLYAMLKHFLSNRRRKDQTQKRGGPPLLSAADFVERPALESIVAQDLDPAGAFDRTWALSVRRAAMERLAGEQTSPAQIARFAALRRFIVHPPTADDNARLSSELAMTRNQLAVALHRLTRRYGELIRSEVSTTLEDPREVETELRSLIAIAG